MIDKLFDVKMKFCTVCKVGGYSRRTGNKLYGTSIDYIFKVLKVPYVFVYEVYSDLMSLPEIARLIKSQKLKNSHKRHNALISNRNKFMYNNLSYQEFKKNQCFLRFNPQIPDTYNFIVNNWTAALFYMIENLN